MRHTTLQTSTHQNRRKLTGPLVWLSPEPSWCTSWWNFHPEEGGHWTRFKKKKKTDMHLIPQHTIYWPSDSSERQHRSIGIAVVSLSDRAVSTAANLDVFVNEGTVSDTVRRSKWYTAHGRGTDKWHPACFDEGVELEWSTGKWTLPRCCYYNSWRQWFLLENLPKCCSVFSLECPQFLGNF